MVVWFIGFLCIKAMKKIEPNNRIYPVWVLFIVVLFTLFSIHERLG